MIADADAIQSKAKSTEDAGLCAGDPPTPTAAPEAAAASAASAAAASVAPRANARLDDDDEATDEYSVAIRALRAAVEQAAASSLFVTDMEASLAAISEYEIVCHPVIPTSTLNGIAMLPYLSMSNEVRPSLPCRYIEFRDVDDDSTANLGAY